MNDIGEPQGIEWFSRRRQKGFVVERQLPIETNSALLTECLQCFLFARPRRHHFQSAKRFRPPFQETAYPFFEIGLYRGATVGQQMPCRRETWLDLDVFVEEKTEVVVARLQRDGLDECQAVDQLRIPTMNKMSMWSIALLLKPTLGLLHTESTWVHVNCSQRLARTGTFAVPG